MGSVLEAAWGGLEGFVGWVFSPSWLPPEDFELYRWLFTPGFGYGFLLIAIALWELVRPQHRRTWTRSSCVSGTYLLLAGKTGVYALVVTPLLRRLWVGASLPSAHLDRILPLPVYALVAVLVLTFIAYWSHRLMHRVPLLWNIHKIHHAPRNLNWTTVYHRHLLELVIHTPLTVMATLALGTELVAPFGIVFMAVDVLGHANVKLDLGRLSYVISTPQAHRVHHSAEPRHYDRNFGTTFMLWDLVFGTFHYDPDHPPEAYGLSEAEVPTSFWKQQVLPLVWIGRSLRERAVGRAAVVGADLAVVSEHPSPPNGLAPDRARS